MNFEQLEDISELVKEWMKTDDDEMFVIFSLSDGNRIQILAKNFVEQIDIAKSKHSVNGLMYFNTENHSSNILDIFHIVRIEIL